MDASAVDHGRRVANALSFGDLEELIMAGARARSTRPQPQSQSRDTVRPAPYISIHNTGTCDAQPIIPTGKPRTGNGIRCRSRPCQGHQRRHK